MSCLGLQDAFLLLLWPLYNTLVCTMKFACKPALTVLFCILFSVLLAFADSLEKRAPAANLDKEFAPVDALVQQEVLSQEITGAVLLVGHDGKVIHQKAFGLRVPSRRLDAMTLDTVFDLASLTKVVATTPSVMRLVQFGQIRLNDPVIRWIPEFGANGKAAITIRHLLTHYSGLRPALDLNVPWQGMDE